MSSNLHPNTFSLRGLAAGSKPKSEKTCTAALAALLLLMSPSVASALEGTVSVGKQGLSDAEVTLWKASPAKAPENLASANTSETGAFEIDYATQELSRGDVLYFTARKGDQLALMAVVTDAADMPDHVSITPITTVGSIWPINAFLKDGEINGPEMGLYVGALNVANLANIETGGWGDRIVDGINAWQSTSLARMNSLANLTSLCATDGKDAECGKFLELAGGSDTISALSNVARFPQTNTDELFQLSQSAWPIPDGSERLSAPYVPYLDYTPANFALMVRFDGGGLYAPGKLHIDPNGNIWSGQNWMPGSQSSVVKGIGGGLVKQDPAGKALSPAITGFNGVNVDGIGWGTAVTKDAVWVSGFSGNIGVYDFDGKPLVGPEGISFGKENGGLQGVGTAINGDVWVADSTMDQMLHFPSGDPNSGEIVQVEGLAGPFGVVIDKNNRVWVSNSKGNTVTTFPADDPKSAEQITVGVGVRGIAADLDGNIWAVSNMTPGFPLVAIPDGASIMDEFRLAYENLVANADKLPTGTLHMISGEAGSWTATLMDAGAINVPWGMTVDGKGNLWFGNFVGESVVHICGARVENCPEGVKTGEMIGNYTSGIIELVTDAIVDSAGTVWAANNWNDGDVIAQTDKSEKKSTWGGGFGVVAIFGGIAAPVNTPLIGVAEPLD